MIRVSGLVQHYGVRPVLRGIDLDIGQGELVAVMGPNGMGKSTLLAAMAGALSPQKGTIEIDGKRRRGSPEEELAIRRITVYLPDHTWLPTNQSGRNFLLTVGRLYGVVDDRLFDHIDRLLRLFSLEAHADAPIASYSAGQQKKIALSGALVSDAKIMILDEPFSGGLDPSGLMAIRKVLGRLAAREDVTVVIAAPVPELLEGLAHRIAILRDGKLAAFDTVDGLRKQAGCDGPLEEALERLIDPHTMENVAHYFEGSGT